MLRGLRYDQCQHQAAGPVQHQCMNSQILAAAYFLQRLHGASFAASFLEDYGVSREWALRLLADRPPERPLPARPVGLRVVP